jgi:excisionase family DNA binding protein
MNPTQKRAPTMLSVAQTAERFGVCPKTILRWGKAGRLPIHRINRTVRISEDDAARFMASCRE